MALEVRISSISIALQEPIIPPSGEETAAFCFRALAEVSEARVKELHTQAWGEAFAAGDLASGTSYWCHSLHLPVLQHNVSFRNTLHFKIVLTRQAAPQFEIHICTEPALW